VSHLTYVGLKTCWKTKVGPAIWLTCFRRGKQETTGVLGIFLRRISIMRLLGLIAVTCFFVGIASAHAAPAQLYNKTVSIGWSVQSKVRDPDGTERVNPSNISYVVYISSAGRLFERSSRSDSRRSATGEISPGANQTRSGEARGLRFEGNNLVANRGYSGAGGSGAMRAVVTFDAGYSGCAVTVTHGKENGGVIKRKGLDGVVREILSITVTSTSCSVRDGNAFAEN
jgi:hypothetical protein